MDWNSEDDPTAPGWYAVMICWDPHEGFFPDACEWAGRSWTRGDYCNATITHHGAGPFATKAEAKAWAVDHDPDW